MVLPKGSISCADQSVVSEPTGLLNCNTFNDNPSGLDPAFIMLSNPSNIQSRIRQHRRQNSTPTAFESVKIQNLPNIQRHGGHRRGMSLDQRRRPTSPQDNSMVSITNTGYPTTPQHILQETQQQRLVRPGSQYVNYDNDENYLRSPTVTPQRQSFDAGCTNMYGDPGDPSSYIYNGPINTSINVNPNHFNGANDFNLFSSEAVLTPSAFLDFSSGYQTPVDTQSSSQKRHSAGRRISGGIVDRVAQFESLALKSPSRPLTPPNQNVSSYFPPTPRDTPYGRTIRQRQAPQRFMDDYDTSMEETIKPKSNQRARGVFDDMRKEAERNSIPSPPRSGQMPSASSFDSAPMPIGNFMNLSSLSLDYAKQESLEGSQSSPVSSALSYPSSPEMHQMGLFDPFANKPDLEAPKMYYPEPPAHGLSQACSPTTSSHHRSDSVTSINLDESITDTGITIDDIATYISGPDVDGKWVCLFPDCRKRFGRKENIKSHVQTHLGDRQFQCPHCKKCFVRQHDLKRHAKIHSGVKPYPCKCGNSFARHDALTRHRQRGMCVGAFEGVVKKVVKRGRPCKNRPDNEERLKKSSRTRSKNKAASSSASSTSYSDSNSGLSPRSEPDDVLDDKPFGDYEYNRNFRFPRLQSPGPDYTVPQETMNQVYSPSVYSNHSAYSEHRGSVASIAEHLPSQPNSPIKSIHSANHSPRMNPSHSVNHSPYHSPPGLCDSSSSPAPSNHFYDLDNSAQGDFKLANISENEDEMFLDAFSAATTHDLTQLERHPEMLLDKFDDIFTPTGAEDDLFRQESDAFFGSS